MEFPIQIPHHDTSVFYLLEEEERVERDGERNGEGWREEWRGMERGM
jgi:hypothetical protein